MIFKRRSLVVVAGINGDSAYTQDTTSRLVLFLSSIFFQWIFPYHFFLSIFTSLLLVREMLVAASLVRIENKQTTLQVDSLLQQTRWLLYNNLA